MNDGAALLLATLIGLVLVGCHPDRHGGDLEGVRATMEDRIGHRLCWGQGTREDEAVNERIQSLLRTELTANSAIQIALLRNPSLQATLEELQISQADLVQAGLLENPVFFVQLRIPDHSSAVMNNEFSLTRNFIDLFLIPARKKVAAAELERTKERVGQAVLDLAIQVKEAFYDLQGRQQGLAVQQELVRIANATGEIAQWQHTAGDIADLDLANLQALSDRAEVEVTLAEGRIVPARERLNLLMGIDPDQEAWTVTAPLPNPPVEESRLASLEARALAQRCDLAAARQEERGRAAALDLARKGIISTLEIGGDTEREPDGTNVTGPVVRVELPIFDRRQAVVARAEARLRQSQNQRMALEGRVRSEVRTAFNQMQTARSLAEKYRTRILPRQTRIVALARQQYQAMVLGVYKLLETREQELKARQQYIQALGDYWTARVRLERAIGSELVTRPCGE